MELILASSSSYRRQLLERLMLPFRCENPDIDETPLSGENPKELVSRLSAAKAQVIATRYPDALVIGSDQVATIGDRVLGKPGGHNAACGQLAQCSGKRVEFYTGLCVQCSNSGVSRHHVERFSVDFRPLSEDVIDRYLLREKPFDCAGSFKCEGLGITLFRRLRGDDPTSLEGLPLIALTGILLDLGLEIYN